MPWYSRGIVMGAVSVHASATSLLRRLQTAMSAQAAQDPSIAPVNFSLESLAVPTDVVDAVRLGLVDEVETVLIQSDLTAVATGPIEPRVHHILRRFAVVEARGVDRPRGAIPGKLPGVEAAAR